VRRPCLDPSCGELIEAGSRCDEHRIRRTRTQPSAASRGYGSKWRSLSRRAVAAQGFCSACHTTGSPENPLTLDHTPASWAKVAAGKTLTLKDCADGLLTVLCLRDNIAAGAARGNNVTRQ
jgi:cytochrome c5